MSLLRAVDDLVVDIGYVHNVRDLVPLVLQVANNDIERKVGSGVAYVTVVIDSRSTYVDVSLVSAERLKRLHSSRQRVVDLY